MPHEVSYPHELESTASIEDQYNWIVRFSLMNSGITPNIRELSRGWQISLGGVTDVLSKLEGMGWISFYKTDTGARRAGSMRLERKMIVPDLSHLETPKVSVVISTYNRPNSLVRLLDTLGNQVHAKFEDLEVIIMDDGGDVEVTIPDCPFGVRYFWSERHPEGKPRLYSLKNQGVSLAENPVIWILDDDLYFDDHTLFILRLYHTFLADIRPMIIPHYANATDPVHYQAPFGLIYQPIDWDKLRVWTSFAGMSFWKEDWQAVGGIDEDYDGAMGFCDLDFGLKFYEHGTQVMLVDGITCFIDDAESGGSHRDRHLYNHANARRFVRKWPGEWAKYDPGLADVA